jgi:hypothetical protein
LDTNFIDKITFDKITLSASLTETALTVFFEGNMDMEDPEPVFDAIFPKISSRLLESPVDILDFNFENLFFLNSKSIKIIIVWLKTILAANQNPSFSIRFTGNPKIPWQPDSLKLLSMLSPRIIRVTI